MKLLFCAGEPSGDQRGAELLREISRIAPTEAFGIGGDEMEAAGMEIVLHHREMTVMGFTEVFRALPRIIRAWKTMKGLAIRRKPDALVLVDYPEFNMRLGAWARRRGIPVVQYIAPQMWAWGSWRTATLKRACDRLLVILPFEEEFFRGRGIPAVYTGHPICGRVAGPLSPPDRPGRIALLPGSRTQEVKRLLPEMLKALHILRGRGIVHTGAIAVSRSVDPRAYPASGEGIVLEDLTLHALEGASAALVCSGTATLETALRGVPQVICYRTGALNYLLARLLVRGVGRIGLANLVADTDVAPELIQKNARADRMADRLESLLRGRDSRAFPELVRKSLAGGRSAAEEVLGLVQGR